jgi:para-nitrobenzyl esterase
MVWIPGGGFTDGGEAMPVYDGATLARRGIVVVTINYRVAAFGLLTHPALQPEQDGASGNYTLRDALAALRWVHANIAAFGGDPGRVTIAGQSAGAALAYIMVDSPETRGLFHGAILQSFSPWSETLPDRAEAEAVGVRIAQELHATGAASLRAASAEAVLHTNGDGLNLYVDNVIIRDAHFASPPYLNDVPIMAGMTADELSFLSPDLARYREAAARYGGAFSQLYPATNDAEALDAFLRSDREATMVGLQRWAHGTRGGAPLYLYLWDHVLPGPNAQHYRAFHSSEVIYVFGSFAAAPERPFTVADLAISKRMLDYWSNFVKTGNPNSEGVQAWPRADVEAPVLMELGDRFAPMAPLPATVSAFFNAYDDTHDLYRF